MKSSKHWLPIDDADVIADLAEQSVHETDAEEDEDLEQTTEADPPPPRPSSVVAIGAKLQAKGKHGHILVLRRPRRPRRAT